jgi:hypothetical protein
MFFRSKTDDTRSMNDIYRVVRIMNIVTLLLGASLTIDSRGVNYNHNIFIIQATQLQIKTDQRYD